MAIPSMNMPPIANSKSAPRTHLRCTKCPAPGTNQPASNGPYWNPDVVAVFEVDVAISFLILPHVPVRRGLVPLVHGIRLGLRSGSVLVRCGPILAGVGRLPRLFLVR